MTENTLKKLAQLLEQDQFELIFSEKIQKEDTSQPAAEFKADFNDLNYFKNIYHQEYIRTAHQSGKKYRSLNGAVQRAVVEKAMLRTEAYKFSRYGQGELNGLTPEKRKERTEFIFQKYCTFYAYSDESRKYRRGLQDILTEEQTFLYLHPMEKDRASARREKIRQMAQEIDAGQYRGYDITRFYRQRQGQEL